MLLDVAAQETANEVAEVVEKTNQFQEVGNTIKDLWNNTLTTGGKVAGVAIIAGVVVLAVFAGVALGRKLKHRRTYRRSYR